MQKILVVDDEPEVAKALRRTFRGSFEVQVALCPTTALAMLDSFQPDVVISDFRMPAMSGADLLTEVRRRIPGCLRLLLSGYTDQASIAASLNKGLVSRFLPKPWDNDELVVLVTELLEHPERRAQEAI